VGRVQAEVGLARKAGYSPSRDKILLPQPIPERWRIDWVIRLNRENIAQDAAFLWAELRLKPGINHCLPLLRGILA
jgi:hypothetical protein